MIILSGCATTRTPEQIEWREGIDRENWAACRQAYNQAGKPTWSRHRHETHIKHRPSDVTEDLMLNFCRVVLGDSHIDY